MENLTWIRKGQTCTLTSDGSALLTLTFHSAVSADFILNDKPYSIRTKGMWNPVCYVTREGTEILKLSHSLWGSKGKISFHDGSSYESEYTSKGGLKLRFSAAGNEILSYSVAFENKRPVMVFKMGVEIIDADKLLILAALGMALFSGIFREMAGDGDENMAFFLTAIA